jgi:hypothetical protein
MKKIKGEKGKPPSIIKKNGIRRLNSNCFLGKERLFFILKVKVKTEDFF